MIASVEQNQGAAAADRENSKLETQNFPQPFRLGCAVPWPEDGTSYHRALGPLQAMAAEGRQGRRQMLELVRPANQGKGWELSWDFVAGCDAVLLQRPALPVYLQFAKLVKAMGKPLWIDWDDDYSCIPPSNPAFADYTQAGMVERLRELAWLADVISVATPELGRRIPRSQQAKVWVVPNACMPVYQSPKSKVQSPKTLDGGQGTLDCPRGPWFDEPRRQVISWRGTDSHDEDLATVLPAIAELARHPQLAGWKWHFSGAAPWEVHEALPKESVEVSPFVGPVWFVPLLAAFAPYIHLCPLKKNAFNLCKSNLAWLEATCAGAVVLAPDWEEWQRPGIIHYRDLEQFKARLLETARAFTHEQLHPNVAQARRYIAGHLLLARVNGARWLILQRLVQ